MTDDIPRNDPVSGNDAAPKPAARRSWQRWFQFSLRSLFLFMTLAAVVVAWQRERLTRWSDQCIAYFRPPAPAAPPKDARDPNQVVTDFLELASEGKWDEAELLLSPKSREVLHQLKPLPTPSTSIAFKPTAVELAGEEAKVKTKIAVGEVDQTELTLVVRQCDEGWRIRGVILPPEWQRRSADGLRGEGVALPRGWPRIDFEDDEKWLRSLNR